MVENGTGSMACLRRHLLQTQKLSTNVTNMIIDGWKDGTKKQYSNAFTKWEGFCKKADINPLEGNIKYGLDFLYSIYAE